MLEIPQAAIPWQQTASEEGLHLSGYQPAPRIHERISSVWPKIKILYTFSGDKADWQQHTSRKALRGASFVEIL
jgi:hypothetical protein